MYSGGEEGSNGGVFGDRSESLIVVFPPLLSKPFSAESCLVKAVVICATNPTRFDDFVILGARDKRRSS